MTLANTLTFLRVALSPLFFIIYLLPHFFPAWFPHPQSAAWTIPVLWVIFVVAEITDMLDGMAARKRGEVSDFGKLFDPFADTLMQITCFLCFVLDGIFPAALFLLALFLSPLFLLIPSAATAPALIIVGFLMMRPVTAIDFTDPAEGIPAFLTIVIMPFAYSIAEGIVYGLLSLALLKTASGRFREVSLVCWILFAIFIFRFFL